MERDCCSLCGRDVMSKEEPPRDRHPGNLNDECFADHKKTSLLAHTNFQAYHLSSLTLLREKERGVGGVLFTETL